MVCVTECEENDWVMACVEHKRNAMQLNFKSFHFFRKAKALIFVYLPQKDKSVVIILVGLRNTRIPPLNLYPGLVAE